MKIVSKTIELIVDGSKKELEKKLNDLKSKWKDFSNWGKAMAYYRRTHAHEIKKGGRGWVVIKYMD